MHSHTVTHFTSLLHRDNNTSTTARYKAPCTIEYCKPCYEKIKNKVKDITQHQKHQLVIITQMTPIQYLSTIICSRSSFCYFQFLNYEITIAFPMSGKYLSAYGIIF